MLVYDVMELAIEEGASDVHFTVGAPPTLRIDGELETVETQPLDEETVQEVSEEVASESELETLRESGSCDFGYDYRDGYRFRIVLFRQDGKPGLVMRLVPEQIYNLEELGLPEQLKDLTETPDGLILVTGPTGSGKTTTLASFLNYINETHRYHVVTIENPVEFKYEHKKSLFNQRELGDDVLSFADGVRSALRMDPDVILVGEMRDRETIRATMTAAETGHLVLSTLHTNSATQTINRIIDMFPEDEQNQVRSQLSMTLSAVISQSLLPRYGESGRIAAFEVLVSTPGIRNMIRERNESNIPSAIQTGRKHGMRTKDDHLLELYKRGKITSEDALRYATDPQSLRKKVE